MRIALVTSMLIAYHAVPNSIINKYKALKKAGHEVSIFTQEIVKNNLPEEVLENAYILTPEQINKFNNGSEPFTATLEKWYDAQLYLFDYPHYYPLVEEIKRVEGITGYIYHGITPPAFAEGGEKSLYTISILFINILKKADFGFVYSQYTRNELIKTHGFSPRKVFQIPFGVSTDIDDISFSKELVSKLKLNGKHILTYVGRISPHKNIEFLIRAIPDLIKVDADIFLLIIGDDTGDYEKEKLRLTNIAKNLNVDKYIKFTGLVQNLQQYYALSDIIISASLHEGCWVPGLEAIAAKKPIVASDSTAIPYTIGSAGLCFDATNKKDYVEKVMKVLKDKQTKEKLKKAAHSKIDKISLDSHDQAFEKVINGFKHSRKKQKYSKIISPDDLNERLKILEQIKDFKLEYHEFSDRKIIGHFLSKFRDLITRHIRYFYIKPLERAQANFNDAVVESYRLLLEYIAAKEKWKFKVGKNITNNLDQDFYNREYFIGGNKSNYGDYKDTKSILISLADMVFDIFHPKTLLDIGCAYGYVPIRLRQRGVKSYGVDISKFAIEQGNKTYLTVGDATNLSEFKNKQFETVLSSELMEHIPENRIDAALKEAVRLANKYIVYLIAMRGFASHEGDHDHDISHVSVKNRKFWLDKFYKFGLTRNLQKERLLNNHSYSVKMGWSGRFFVLNIPKNG